MPDYLGVEQVVAQFPWLTRDSLYQQRYRREGIGALAFKVGGKLVWDRQDILDHLADLRHAAHHPPADDKQTRFDIDVPNPRHPSETDASDRLAHHRV